MKRQQHLTLFAAGLLLASAGGTLAATHYVDQNSTNATPPYTSWTTAATNIQDAVDAGVAGDEIVVTNGIYASGGRAVYGTLTSRVAVDKPLALRSVNGPQFTIIQGRQLPGTNNGDGAIRCVYLTNGASLSDFTLTNGATRAVYDYPTYRESSGGGVWCESTNNCVVSNCVMTGNVAYDAGVAYGGTLNNCVLNSNSYIAASYSTLNNCTLSSNSFGADSSALNNCTLTGNFYGALSSTLNNCALIGNLGYGAYVCGLTNCTLTGNANGVYNCTLANCIAYFNSGSNYDSSSTLSYSCTMPLPTNGVGNISVDPQLASASHLSAASPCRGAGNAAYASGTDIDGEAWLNPPSIGCDEYDPGAVTGPLSAVIIALRTNVLRGFSAQLTALIEGRTTGSVWDFGDGITVSNQPYASHAWTAGGDYKVVLRAYSESQPGGVSATVAVHVVDSTVLYVAAAGANPVPPYTTWATAATNIQDAVDVAAPGDEIVVTNGIYAGGGRDGNRVEVDKPLSISSVNGPQVTTIDGGPQVTNFFGGVHGSVRCGYLTNSATLSGFTLTNGWSYPGAGGGVWCAASNSVVSNCVIWGNQGASGGGAYGGILNNCTLANNSAQNGGGAYGCTLNNCTLEGNWTFLGGYGGGAANCTLINCTLSGNSANGRYGSGGGAYNSTLNNCTLNGNSAGYGGGAGDCSLNNCTLTGNTASNLFNLIRGPYGYGGGAYSSRLTNCTVTGNSAINFGGGVLSSTLNNCIVYFNICTSDANYDSASVLNYCCTTPLPTNGVGNISSDPQLASASHLSAFSPCIGKGNYAAVSGTDIDGEPWANPPSMGCDEYHAGSVTGPLSVAITASFTNVAVGYPVAFTGLIEGRTDLSVWEFGDGALEINEPYTAHSWSAPGDYLVWLWAFNDSYPGGISASVTVHVVISLHYVAAGSANPMPPYSSWTTAATNIQDAIDAAPEPGAQVLVTNGTYAPITANGPLSVRSINGAQFTIIDGGHSNRCASLSTNVGHPSWLPLSTNVSLSGFTLTNGYASGGGGSYGGTLSNCVLSGNSASDGGGASGCTLNNCTLSGNSASDGGGASGCTLNNCTLSGNSAYDSGGGADSSTLNNCIAYFNAPDGANYDTYSTLNYCCTTPLPAGSFGNITNAPLFMDTNGWANLRLQSNSPCINAGKNAYAPAGPDLDGSPRIAGGTVDIGAYEFQAPVSKISYAWLQQYGLPINADTDTADPDGDAVDNYHEWLAGTNPTNRFSSPAQLTITPSGVPPNGIILMWSTNAVGFALQSATDLTSTALWTTNLPAPVVIGGQNVVTNPISGAQQFYRLVH